MFAHTETVEEIICQQTGRKHCFLVGRGTTAIHLALKAVERRVGLGEVILPTVSCASIAQIALYAGFKPVFADVGRDTFTLDADALRGKISRETRAVLPIHVFGHAAPMDPICELAAEHGFLVIEDAAQSIGGNYGGRKMGGLGDFSILSFGGEKIINAGAGGALLTDDDDLAAILGEEIKSLPEFSRPIGYGLKSLSHRNLYHSVVDLLRVDNTLRVDEVFMGAVPFYEDLYLQRFPDNSDVLERIARGFETLAAENESRVGRAALYQSLLEGADLRLSSSWEESGVLWRYSFLVNDAAKTTAVTAALRKNKIHASNHYWSVADLFYGEKDHPNTSFVCPRIVNLWVDAVATEEYIARSCEVILRSLG
jgi:dTDP-4-amino-4,6-dideoxygalactose transaminase